MDKNTNDNVTKNKNANGGTKAETAADVQNAAGNDTDATMNMRPESHSDTNVKGNTGETTTPSGTNPANTSVFTPTDGNAYGGSPSTSAYGATAGYPPYQSPNGPNSQPGGSAGFGTNGQQRGAGSFAGSHQPMGGNGFATNGQPIGGASYMANGESVGAGSFAATGTFHPGQKPNEHSGKMWGAIIGIALVCGLAGGAIGGFATAKSVVPSQSQQMERQMPSGQGRRGMGQMPGASGQSMDDSGQSGLSGQDGSGLSGDSGQSDGSGSSDDSNQSDSMGSADGSDMFGGSDSQNSGSGSHSGKSRSGMSDSSGSRSKGTSSSQTDTSSSSGSSTSGVAGSSASEDPGASLTIADTTLREA
ncbi:hypothetical protein PT279_01535 [Bifidobacterium sp. ESL0784]|uniref:hypothetical protein n=1 Tax=Bifidobacterium sp. ESL0784 TaxID=2983231 RepID=UPI0023F91332|nr:hypothetical protein [Bifidobacterium sp. ESL0784]MDF7640281.1 hypothetical protein [Bifidobacterium sp. ESL0784]